MVCHTVTPTQNTTISLALQSSTTFSFLKAVTKHFDHQSLKYRLFDEQNRKTNVMFESDLENTFSNVYSEMSWKSQNVKNLHLTPAFSFKFRISEP